MIDGLLRRLLPPPPPPPPPKKETPAPQPAKTPAGFTGQSTFEAQVRAPVVLTPPATPRPLAPAATSVAARPEGTATPAPTPTATGGASTVREASRAIEAAYTSGGAKAAAAELRSQTEALPHPAQVDKLIAAAQPTIDRISTDLANGVKNDSVDHDTNRDVLRDLDATVSRAGQAGRDAVATSVAKKLSEAVPQGSAQLGRFDDALVELAKDGVGGKLSSAVSEKLINDLGRVEAGHAVRDTSVDAIKEVRADYEAKAEELTQVETRLNKELAQLGPALTPEEIEAYKEAFWEREDNADIRDAARAAGDTLSETLTASTAELEALAAQGDPGATKALFDGYKALAETPNHADEALQFAGRINQDAGLAKALSKEYGGDFEQKLSDEILAPAVPNAQAEAIAEAGEGGFDVAMKEFSSLVKGLKTGHALVNIPGDVQQMLTDIRDIRAGTFTQDQVQEMVDAWGNESPLGRSLAGATLGLGLYDLPSQLADGEYLEAIKNTLTSSADGIELTSGVLNTLGKTGAATDVAKFGAKFVPLLGLGADAIQAYQDVQALRDGVSAGDVFNLAGSVVSLAGDIAGFVPVAGTAVDVVATVAGEALRTVGSLLNGDLGPDLEDFSVDEATDILQDTLGLSEAEVQLLLGGTNSGYGKRMQALGLDPLQVREVLTQTEPPLFAFSDGLGSYEPIGNARFLFETVAAFGLSGDAAFEFIQEHGNALSAFEQVDQYALPESSLGAATSTGDFSAFREEALRLLPDDIAEDLEPYLDATPNTEFFEA
ncbi:hypothetical protein [Corallococcus exercitus]|uniref:hypothetical protein n=1 Tax=Corallococcus exercitus TaxID=2316736 RepID=UPI0035D405C4